ncbi:MAG TPA: glutamyl-tRNA reductase [Acidimicrobiales bacterium]|nr:glutamyl-tRNA reductase [Acidimicrobiales bacterium]
MSVVVIGLNHRTAPLELLERMSVPDGQVPKALHDLCSREHISEAMVLSTCNRVEVYADAERFHGAYSDIRGFLAEHSFLPPETFADHLYVHYDSSAAAHLFAVTAGLDSAVLGESEIQGQVKQAWDRARDQGAAGPGLNLLLRHALEGGKRARTETGIGRKIASVSQAAVAMARERLGGLAGKTVLLLGAGDMGEGMAVALAGAGERLNLMVANRTQANAVALAARIGAEPVALVDVPDRVTDIDLLLTSTGAQTPIIERADLEPVMIGRSGRPLLVVDIAVPRDVDPGVADIDGVTLLDMDDLRGFAAVGVAGRRREVAAAEAILNDELERYLDASSAREVAPMIVALRERAEVVRKAELERFRGRLDDLGADHAAVVDAVTKRLVSKLLHQPTVVLKDAAGSPRGDRLVAALRELFEIEG